MATDSSDRAGPDSSAFRVAVMMAATARAVGDREVTVNEAVATLRNLGRGTYYIDHCMQGCNKPPVIRVYDCTVLRTPKVRGRQDVITCAYVVVTQHHRLLDRELAEHALAVGWSDTPKELAQPVDE